MTITATEQLIEELTETLCRDMVMYALMEHTEDNAITALRRYQNEPEHRAAVYQLCRMNVLKAFNLGKDSGTPSAG